MHDPTNRFLSAWLQLVELTGLNLPLKYISYCTSHARQALTQWKSVRTAIYMHGRMEY